MTHIYAVRNVSAEADSRRKMIRAEINILRKFEGRMLIEERIANNMARLHAMTFSASRKEKENAS